MNWSARSGLVGNCIFNQYSANNGRKNKGESFPGEKGNWINEENYEGQECDHECIERIARFCQPWPIDVNHKHGMGQTVLWFRLLKWDIWRMLVVLAVMVNCIASVGWQKKTKIRGVVSQSMLRKILWSGLINMERRHGDRLVKKIYRSEAEGKLASWEGKMRGLQRGDDPGRW